MAARQRLSAVRQRIGLEPQGTTMRQLAPSPPTGPANKPGAALQAMQPPAPINVQTTQPAQVAAPVGQPISQHPAYNDMLQQTQAFLQQIGPGQQSLIDGARAAQQQSQATVIPADSPVAKALGPMAQFFKQNGRLPSPDELRNLSVSTQLEQQLGRSPTKTELELYLMKPPRA